MRNYIAKSVDEYIEQSPDFSRKKMTELRNALKELLPEATETIAWGIPFYKIDKTYIVGFTYFKNYISFGFTKQVNEEIKKAFEEQGYKTTLKTIQINYTQPVPKDLIKLAI